MKRTERLAKGCCPEHGIGFTQLSGWFDEGMSTSYTVVECPRRDCTFRASMVQDGPGAFRSEPLVRGAEPTYVAAISVIVQPDKLEDGTPAFRAFAPALPGCEVWDSSHTRALERATQAVRLSIGLLAFCATTDRQGSPS